jgi:SAM-dependent methyltransferase
MTDWTGGYVADVSYTFGYYRELSPLRTKLALLNARLALPDDATACELGFGQGLSTNIHAAATTTQWYGTDFNPSQAAFAQQLARSFPNGPALHDQAFAEFCARVDLPDFDYIGLHGIWSWISNENRAVIVDFIRRKLKLGGVLYISYNTQPGWAPMVPLRNLLAQHAQVMSPPGAGIMTKADDALAFAQRLWATNPVFAKANPQVGERLKQIQGQNRQYVAHEYFNRDWLPMSFAEMAEWLSPAKIDFACSATYGDHVPQMHLTPEQLELLKELPSPAFRESVRDFMVNQQFRRDYWIKGARQITPIEYIEQLREQRVILIVPRDSVTLTIKGALGDATLGEAIYAPILDLLGDHRPRTIGQIAQAVREKNINLVQIHQACLLLAEKGALAAAQDEATVAKCRPQTDLINRALLRRAFDSTELNNLASPVTGGGVLAHSMTQWFITALMAGKTQPEEWADHVWQRLKSQGQAVVKDGVPLEGEEANLAELLQHARTFGDERLKIFKALGVI